MSTDNRGMRSRILKNLGKRSNQLSATRTREPQRNSVYGNATRKGEKYPNIIRNFRASLFIWNSTMRPRFYTSETAWMLESKNISSAEKRFQRLSKTLFS